MRPRRVAYLLQNVGAIENDGWEVQATVSRGPLALASSLTLVDSRVRQIARRYQGELRVGDRMLEVPARTIGGTATWTAPRWTLSASVARADDWINYDRLALTAAFGEALREGTPPPLGPALRGYWREYAGVTRLGVRMDVALRGATWLTLRGDNLLGRQVGEPDNVTVLPGRTVLVGVRAGI
jgi:iron complex outermembrane receptor protein